MFNIDQKDYIVKLSSGKTINFFYQSGVGIYSRILTNEGAWTEPQALIKDAMPSFSLCINSNDTVYILFQNTRGDILYSTYAGDKISQSNTLIGRNGLESSSSQLFVTPVKGMVLFIYTVEQINERILAYQVLKENSELTRPAAADYITGKKPYFSGAYDRNGDLYLFYRNRNRYKNTTGYRRFNAEKVQWETFESLIGYEGDYGLISAEFDRHDNIHLLWQKKYPQKHELVYSLKHLGADVWDEKVLCTASEPFINSSIFAASDTVICYWVNKSGIFYLISKNNGITWKGIEKYSHDNVDAYCCINFYSNYRTDVQTYATDMPGKYVNGYELAFLSSVELSSYKKPEAAVNTPAVSDLFSRESASTVDELLKRVNMLEMRLRALEDEVQRSNKFKKPETSSLPTAAPNFKVVPVNTPIMEGACFKNITWDYIESLGRRGIQEG
jgi:hypothetical protein